MCSCFGKVLSDFRRTDPGARTLLIAHERGADQLFAAAGEDVAVGIGRRWPGDVASGEWKRRFEDARPAKLLVALVGQLGANQFAAIGVEQDGIAAGSQ